MTTTQFHHHPSCPSWCVNRHGLLDGEEDWVHTGWVTATAGGVMVKLTISIDPNTQAVDGPYIVLGDEVLTIDDARFLGHRLTEMADGAELTNGNAHRKW